MNISENMFAKAIFDYAGVDYAPKNEEDKKELASLITDLQNYGVNDYGLNGFIYTEDICHFYDKNIDLITEYFQTMYPDDFRDAIINSSTLTAEDIIKQTIAFKEFIISAFTDGVLMSIDPEFSL